MKHVHLNLNKALMAFVLSILIFTGGFINTTSAQKYQLDSLFGANGILVNDIQEFPNQSVKMIPMHDNKFLVAGNTVDLHTLRKNINFFKINSCGEIDYSFGTNGSVIFRQGFSNEVKDVALVGVEKFAFCGLEDDNINGINTQPVVYLFDKNGKPDKTFGNFGKFMLEVPYSTSDFERIHTTSTGAYIVTGKSSAYAINGKTGFIALKLTAQGQFDNTFGNLGVQYYETPALKSTTSIVFSDGSILLLGVTDAQFSKLIMLKLDNEGNPDFTFGSLGIKSLFTQLSSETVRLSAVLSHTGNSFYTTTQRRKSNYLYIQVNKFTIEGNLDPTFGHHGIKYISIGDFDQVYGLHVTKQSVFVYGSTDHNGGEGFVAKMDLFGKDDIDFGIHGIMGFQLKTSLMTKSISSLYARDDEKIFVSGSAEDYVLTRLTTKSNVPEITAWNNNLVSSGVGVHKWLFNGHYMENLIGPSIQPKWIGAYQVIMEDNEGCRIATRPYYFFGPIATVPDGDRIIINSPEDNSISLSIPSLENTSSTFSVSIYSLDGKLVHQRSGLPIDDNSKINLSELSAGIYAVHVVSGNWTYSKKIIKYIQ